MLEDENDSIFGIRLDGETTDNFREAAKWAKMLGIVGFVMIGLLVLICVFMGAQFSRLFGGLLPGNYVWVIYLYLIGIGVLYFMPTLYFFRFGNWTKRAVDDNDQILFNKGVESLKSFLKFMGILTIVLIALYVLALIAGVLGSAIG